MAPRGRRKKAGLMREDAARDAMKDFGFGERVINKSIKELLELYGEGGWFLIEEGRYEVLLTTCLEKAAQEEQEEDEAVQEEEEMEQEEDQDRDQVGSNSTFPVGSDAETRAPQTCQTDALSTTSEAVMDSSPTSFQSAADYAPYSVGGAKSSHCVYLSNEDEESVSNDDGGYDDDEVILHLTPEPLCEELKELLREVRAQKKKRVYF